MFANLEKIDWSKLRQAHGDASLVPTAIQELISNDSDKREAAYWKLDNYIVLQSDLYESAYYVIPFLLEILKSDSTVGREHVYALLSEIANGYAPENITININNKNVPLGDACRSLVSDSVQLYLSEVENKDSEFRSSALDLLMTLKEKSELIKERINALLLTERDSEVADLLREVIRELDEK